MNIILVTIDCFRADALDKMPNLSKIGDDFVSFKRAYSNGGHTAHSLKSLLTSSYPLDYNYMNYVVSSFVEVLKEKGFHTSCFHSNPWMDYFKSSFGKGFDDFINVGAASGIVSTAHSKKVLDRFTNWAKLKELYHQKYFSWLHLMDAHASVHHGDKKDSYVERYFTALKYIDEIFIPEIIKWTDLLIITADHGEELGEYTISNEKRLGHAHLDLTKELLRVPLVIKTNDKEKLVALKKKENQRFSLLNLGSTILDFFNIGFPKTFKGKSLLKDFSDDELVVAERPFCKHVQDMKFRQFLRAYTIDEKLFVVSYGNNGRFISYEWKDNKGG